MTELVLPQFMHLANAYLEGGNTTLATVVAEFRKLESEDKKLRFGQLCRRKLQVNDRLIDLLLAIGALLPCRRPATFRYLEKCWQKRGLNPSLAEEMRVMLTEQFTP
jgi:hypothetical protein